MIRSIFLAVAVAATLTAVAQPATNKPMVHDPVLAYENGTYYLFATGHGIQQMTSTDLTNWAVVREPLIKDIPAWTHDSVPGFKNHVWAPDVIYHHNRWWVAYSCSTFGKNGSAIGLMSNVTLDGRYPWRDDGCIVCSHENSEQWNAIDPNFIVDKDGTAWMTYGSFWDGIQLVRLDDTMHAATQPVTIARRYALGFTPAEPNPTSKYAGTNAIEAPFIYHHNGWYYLFVSWDYCCRGMKSNYRVAVGRSRNVAGPYVDRQGKPMTEGGGTLVIEGDKKAFEAIGHNSVYRFQGQDYYFSHGYSIADKGMSILVKRKINWTRDGWPVLK